MDKDEIGPERTCIVTRRKARPEALIRFVIGPGGGVVPDIRRKLPGRGVWVSAETAAVAKAVKSRGFARGFKAKVEADPDLANEVGRLLEQDALQSLAMANKAGLVTTGFAKVEAALAAGGVVALVQAREAGADGIRKLAAATYRAAAGRAAGAGPEIFDVFTSQQLDLALGRTNVIHAALAAGPAGQAFLTRCRRSIAYRTPSAHPEAGAHVATA